MELNVFVIPTQSTRGRYVEHFRVYLAVTTSVYYQNVVCITRIIWFATNIKVTSPIVLQSREKKMSHNMLVDLLRYKIDSRLNNCSRLIRLGYQIGDVFLTRVLWHKDCQPSFRQPSMMLESSKKKKKSKLNQKTSRLYNSTLLNICDGRT